MSGSRLGTIGWKQKYWDHGEQYNAQGKLINQAHHFTGFFIEGLKIQQSKGFVEVAKKSLILDGLEANPQDIELGLMAAKLGYDLNHGLLDWQSFPQKVYDSLKD